MSTQDRTIFQQGQIWTSPSSDTSSREILSITDHWLVVRYLRPDGSSITRSRSIVRMRELVAEGRWVLSDSPMWRVMGGL